MKTFWKIGLTALTILALVPSSPVLAKTLKFSSETDVSSLDPQSTRNVFNIAFLSNIYEPLVQFDRKNAIEPGLAVSWENVSPTVWHFKLRQGVKFHNGYPFSADDVVFTIARAKHEKSPYRGMASSIQSAKKIDDFTVAIDTGKPTPTLLRDLQAIQVLSKKWTEENGGAEPPDITSGKQSYLTRNANGTGPFKVSAYDPGTQVKLTAFDGWWNAGNKEHNLTTAIFRPVRAAGTRVAALLSGEIDLILPIPAQDVARVKSTPGFKVVDRPSARTVFFGLDVRSDELTGSEIKGKNPLKDLRVREAIYQAIDVDAIVAKVLRGMATPAPIIIAPAVNGYDAKLAATRRVTYDVAAAKAKLAEAGYPNGFSMDMDCTNDRYVADEQVCLAIANMLSRIGVKIKVNARPAAQHFSTVLKGKSPMFIFGWGTDFNLDAVSYLRDLLHTPDGSAKGTWNPGGYSNKRVDELEAIAATEMDPAKRLAAISEAFAINKQEIGHIPVYQEQVIWAARDNIEFVQPATASLFLRWVKVH